MLNMNGMEIENYLKKISDIGHCPVRSVLSRISSERAMLIPCVPVALSPSMMRATASFAAIVESRRGAGA